jgi:prevent-host-death family protein
VDSVVGQIASTAELTQTDLCYNAHNCTDRKEVILSDQAEIKTLKFTDARQNLSQIVSEVFQGKSRVLVEKSGIPVAAIISADDLDRFLRWEKDRKQRFAVLDEIGTAFENVPTEDLEREVAHALAAVRGRSSSSQSPTHST